MDTLQRWVEILKSEEDCLYPGGGLPRGKEIARLKETMESLLRMGPGGKVALFEQRYHSRTAPVLKEWERACLNQALKESGIKGRVEPVWIKTFTVQGDLAQPFLTYEELSLAVRFAALFNGLINSQG